MNRQLIILFLFQFLTHNSLSAEPRLHELIHQGQEQDACRLLAQNPSLALERNQQLETPLHLAAVAGMTQLVEALIGVPGVDLNGRDGYGRTALMAASLGANGV